MNFALLWIDALLVALLWVAALAAVVGRAKRRWVRVSSSPIVVGAPLLPLVTFVLGTAATKFNTHIEPNWFGYALSLLLTFLVGASLILRQAARRDPGLMPAAATWERLPLALAWLTALVVGYMTLFNMDLAIRARCAIEGVRVNSIYLATLPAITTDSQNAAPLYEKAFALLEEDGAEEDQVQNPPTGTRDTFDPNEPATIRFLNHQAATIALLRQAAARPACRFDADITGFDVNTILPGLNERRNAANVLRLDAREAIAHGRAKTAIDDAAAILAMSRHFGQQPLIISALVGFGIDDIGNKTLEEALPAVTSGDDLAGLHLDDLTPMGRVFQQSLRGEEVMGLNIYGSMPQSETIAAQGNPVPDSLVMSPAVGPGGAFFRIFFADPDLDGYQKLLEHLQNAAPQPYYKIREQSPDFIDAITGGSGLFTALLRKSLLPTSISCSKCVATDECALVAVAMTQFKIDHGALPSTLADLVPTYLDAIPLDPFDGKPIRLALRSDAGIIYSVGPDTVDDGGIEMDRKTLRGDIIFTLKSAARTTTQP